MSDASDSIDLRVLSYRFDRLESLCCELDNLIKQPDYSKVEYQAILIKLRDELGLVSIALESNKTRRAITTDFKITPRELCVLIFGGTDNLLEKAFKNDRKSTVELTSSVTGSISLWRTRIIGQYKPDAKSSTNTMQPIGSPKNSPPEGQSKLAFGRNSIFTHRLLGQVEIKYVSFNDIIRIVEFLQETDFRHFTVLVVHNQLVQPKIGLEETEQWPDEVLIEISSKLLDNESTINRHFQRRAERNFFEDFHQAFDEHESEQRERLGIIAKGIQTQVSTAMEQLTSAFNTPGFKAVMQTLATYDFRGLSASMQAIQNMSRFALPPVILPKIRSGWLNAPLMEPMKYHMPLIVDEVQKETIEVLLGDLEPELERKRQGSWQTFQGKGQDRLSQAMNSMREVLRQLLDKLAPEEDIPKAPWYNKPPKGSSAVTRRMRVRYALAGTSHNVSQSTLKLIESLASSIDETYDKLSAESHRLDKGLDVQVEAYLRLSEAVILTLLVNRTAGDFGDSPKEARAEELIGLDIAGSQPAKFIASRAEEDTFSGTGPSTTRPFIVGSSPWRLRYKASWSGHFAVQIRGSRIELVINRAVSAGRVYETYVHGQEGNLHFSIQEAAVDGDWTLWVIPGEK